MRTEERILIEDMVTLCDSLLLLSGHYWRKGIKVGFVRDACDDLLDIRKILTEYLEENDVERP